MNNELRTLDAAITSTLLLYGDMKRLTPEQKNEYYVYKCHLIGVDPACKPFDLLNLNGKEILYPNAICAQVLTANRGLSYRVTCKERVDDVYCVWVEVTDRDGRKTENMGAVNVGGLKGEALANAMMKAFTKGVRRSVFGSQGLGMDESEIETIPGAVTTKWVEEPVPTLAQKEAPKEPWDATAHQTLIDLLGQGTDLLAQLGMNDEQRTSWMNRYTAMVTAGDSPSVVFHRVGESIQAMEKKLDDLMPEGPPINEDAMEADDEDGSIEARISAQWMLLTGRWKDQKMAAKHIENKIKKLISEWVGDEIAGSSEWLHRVFAGQVRELDNGAA